jgi:hypothetical protein
MAIPSPSAAPTLPAIRTFRPHVVKKHPKDARAGHTLWVDERSREAGELSLSFDPNLKLDPGLILHFPPEKRTASDPHVAYWNIRLDIGTGGVWVTPPFVMGLCASIKSPGYTHLSMSQRGSSWIKVKGEPKAVAKMLRIRLLD